MFQIYVDSVVLSTNHTESEGLEIAATINEVTINKSDMHSLATGKLVSKGIMRGVLELFRKRGDHICETYRDVNGIAYTKNVFCPKRFLELLLENPVSPQLLTFFPIIESWREIDKIFILSNDTDDGDTWIMFVVDIILGKIFYVRPKSDDTATDVITQSMHNLSSKINQFLSANLSADMYTAPYHCYPYPVQYYEKQQNDFDSGIYIVQVLYHIVLDCPPAFNSSHMNKFRSNLAYWLLTGMLPY
jgi:hypothetical protein